MAQYPNPKLDRPEPGLIKWSPNPAYDSFLHVNLQHRIVQLYQPTGLVQPNQFDYEKLSKFDEIPPLSTYDWSPAHPGFVAIGTASGSVNLLNLNDNSNHYLEQRLKFARFCQAVAFNTGTLLAVGLERVRNDQCLQVWDVNRLATLEPGVSWSSLDGSALGEPAHRLEPATSVSSTKFFEDSPQTLVVGIKNQGIRIYDLRDPHGAVINYQTKCNNNLAIDYADQNYFASSSLDRPGVVIWDRRGTSRTLSSPWYLDAVDAEIVPYGAALSLEKAIDINPSNIPERGSLIRSLRFCRDHRGLVAALSRTGQLKVLDTKKEVVPLDRQYDESPELSEVWRSHELEMNYGREDRKHDQIVSFDWVTLDSPALTPRVIVLRASGGYEILEKPSYTAEHIFKLVPWQAPYRGLEEGASYHSLMQFDASYYPEMMGPLVVDEALRDIPLFGAQKEELGSIVQNKLQSYPTSSECIVDLETSDSELPDSFINGSNTAEKLSALRKYSNEILGSHTTIKSEKHQTRDVDVEKVEKSMSKMSMESNGPPSNRHLHERLLTTTLTNHAFPITAQIVLDHIMLLRSKERYLFDPAVNRQIVSDDRWLRELWDWIAGATQAALDDGMVAQGIDLSYLGVCHVWTNDLGIYSTARLVKNTNPTDTKTWESCLQTISKSSGQPKYDGVETTKPAHRQAALRMCKWSRSRNNDYAEYNKIPSSERTSSWHTMAAARALFEGNRSRAVQILKKASTEFPELIFVSLALQLIGRKPDGSSASERLDFDDALASKTDPYLRAISSLIATSNWEIIANQESLPLRERTYIALRYFDDDLLTRWLTKELEKAISTGDIEGIVLTGITDPLVDIFAKYIEKFNDIQTATLVLSICSPKYINDYRCTVWRNAYRAYLQRHKAFIQRTKFEVESTKKSKRDGIPTVKPPSRQIALRCVYCDAEYELSTKMGVSSSSSSTVMAGAQAPTASAHGQSQVHQGNPLTATNVNAGVSCPNCGRHLPRCVVCLEVVGIPRSDRPEASPDAQVRVAANFPTFCLRCDHVLHLDHARQWFARHAECPVPECRCRCNFRANPELNYR